MTKSNILVYIYIPIHPSTYKQIHSTLKQINCITEFQFILFYLADSLMVFKGTLENYNIYTYSVILLTNSVKLCIEGYIY